MVILLLDFTPGSNVEHILKQFSEAIYEQPSLHRKYLLHHSWLPSDYFAGAFLLDNLRRVEGLTLFLKVYNALEARFFWGSRGEIGALFLSHILSRAERYTRIARAFQLKLKVSMSGKGRSPEVNSFVLTHTGFPP
jgi:hypothetical protein